MPSQDNQPLPSLAQLLRALHSEDTKLLRSLQRQLNWQPSCASETDGPPEPVDPVYDRVRLAMDNLGPDCLRCTNSDGRTLVHITARACPDEKAIQLIVEAVGQSDQIFYSKDKQGYSAFFWAAWNPDCRALKYLVKTFGSRGLSLTAEDDYGPLHRAAESQGAESMELFKSALGITCFHQAVSKEHRNAFHFAAQNTNGEALAWLINEFGIDALSVKDLSGHTPVHIAARRQGNATLELIFERMGFNMFKLGGNQDESIVHSAARNTETNTALLWCIRMLSGYCLLKEDSLGRRALHLAAQHQNELPLQVAFGDMQEKYFKTRANQFQTVVHFAAMNSQISTLRWLVEKLGPESLTDRDSTGRMPIHIAAQYQGVESLNFIVDCLSISALNIVDTDGRTMAHYAAEGACRAKLIPWIRNKAASILNEPDIRGITAAKLAGIE